MAIPLSQLNTWTNPGALTSSSTAYASIRNALLKVASPVANLGLEIFLQGSYANATNVYGDSDIDVVVLYPATFHKDFSALPPAQQQLHERIFPPATYNWTNLRDDVVRALRSHYGVGAVTPGNKSIKVVTITGRKPADVIPAMEFRRYVTFVDSTNLSAHFGIQLFDASNNPIVNYPKHHIKHGEEKNGAVRTNGQYKPTVRLFKNLRSCLVDNGLLASGIAPSYFIECALYNVPDSIFRRNLPERIPEIITYLSRTPHNSFFCQNGIVPLIGNSTTQWSLAAFVTFLTAAQAGWDNW